MVVAVRKRVIGGCRKFWCRRKPEGTGLWPIFGAHFLQGDLEYIDENLKQRQ